MSSSYSCPGARPCRLVAYRDPAEVGTTVDPAELPAKIPMVLR